MLFLLLGSIIRCMRRLEELLRQMCQASKAIGNTELENKFAEGIFPFFLFFHFSFSLSRHFKSFLKYIIVM